MFKITGHKGFQMVFANGCTVSVQFGVGNYCEHHNNLGNYDAAKKADEWTSAQAEVAAWGPDGRWHSFGNDEVRGYMSPDEVMEFMWDVKLHGVTPAVEAQ